MESLSRYLVLALCCSFLVSSALAAVVCPDGWSTYEAGLSCYKYYDTALEFNDAQAACVTEGANLASVTSQGEHDHILNNIWSSVSFAYVYIGGSDAVAEGTWVWTDGSGWSFESWGIWNRQTLPVHGNVHNCLAMTQVTDTQGDWYDFKCNDTAHYICEKAATNVTATCPTGDGRNWNLVGNKCYFLVRGMKRWQQSQTNCENMGANLASVHDQTTSDFFLNTWVIRYGRGMWIGLNDMTTDQTFEWSDGTTVSYTNWATINGVVQPESTTVKNCVGLESPARGQAVKWNDYKCTMRAWSICQKDAV